MEMMDMAADDTREELRRKLRSNGSHTIIDMVTVHLDIKKDCFFAEFSNLGLTNVPITDDYPEKYDRLLCGGIWCIVQLEYAPYRHRRSSRGTQGIHTGRVDGCYASFLRI